MRDESGAKGLTASMHARRFAIFDRVMASLLTLAALTIAGAAVYRLVRQDQAPMPPIGGDVAGERIEFWREALPLGFQLGGSSNAPVTIVEFADLECPACRGFHATVSDLVSRRPDDVQVVDVSYPLAQHRFALPAARGLECPDSIGYATAWISAVYAHQDSLGVRSWGSIATEAGVPYPALIERCASTANSFERLERGRAFGDRIHIRGTPTVLVNGWKFTEALSSGMLDSTITALAGRDGS